VAASQDPVSKELEAFFGEFAKPTDAQLKRAERRKLLGNPPGKKADPIGDELSWEQLLDCAAGEKEIWIITSDGDYVTEYGDSRYLNPFLLAELKAKCGTDVRVTCHMALAEGIAPLTEALKEQVKTLPTAEQLNGISKEERRSQLQPPLTRLYSTSTLHDQGLTYGIAVSQCPSCGGEMTPVGAFGGYTWAQRCMKCGLRWDTGEDMED